MTFDVHAQLAEILREQTRASTPEPVVKESFLRSLFGERTAPSDIRPAVAPAANLGTWLPVDDDGDLPDEQEDEGGTGPVVRQNFVFKPRRVSFPKPDLTQWSADFEGKEQDRENYVGRRLIDTWKQTKDPELLDQIYGHYEQLLESTIKTHARRRLPEPAIRGQVYAEFLDSLEKFDASRNMQFHNYFTDRGGGREVKRWVDRYSGFSRVSTDRTAARDAVRTAIEEFKATENREPTAEDLVSRVNGIPLTQIRRILPELKSVGLSSRNIRSDYIVDESAAWLRTVNRVAESLPPRERPVFEDYWSQDLGGGVKRMNKGQLAARHNITPQQLAKMLTKWNEQLKTEHALTLRDME